MKRAAIEEAIRRNGKSPIARQPMRIDQLVTDYTLKNVIEELSSSKTEEVTDGHTYEPSKKPFAAMSSPQSLANSCASTNWSPTTLSKMSSKKKVLQRLKR